MIRKQAKQQGYVAVLAAALYWAFEFVSKLATVMHAWEFIEAKVPLITKVPDWALLAFVAGLSLLISMVVVRFILRWRRRHLILPSMAKSPLAKFKHDAKLEFRHARDPQELVELSKTEEYGAAGSTDIEQVTQWWTKYRLGNVLAIYDGKIIGGLDIWPITKVAFEKFERGEMTEHELEAKDILRDVASRCHHWYVGSISLDMVLRAPRTRAELLIRLLIAAIALWKKTVTRYPAIVVAEAWTKEGRQMLVRHMRFEFVARKGKNVQDSRLYKLTIRSPEQVDSLVSQLEALVVPRSPH